MHIFEKYKFFLKIPYFTMLLFFICMAVFFIKINPELQYYNSADLWIKNSEFYRNYAFFPSELFQKPWQIITSIFLHRDMDHLKYNMLYLIIFGYIVEYKLNLKTYLFLLMSIWLIPLISFTAYWIINEKPINYSGIGISGVVYGFMYISYYFMGNFVFNKTKFSKSNGFWSSFMFALFFSVLTFLIDFSVSNCGGGMVHFSGIAVSAFFCYHNYYKKEIIV